MKICIMGTGGLGGVFGALSARAGHDVTLIARGAHLQAIRENGLLVKTPNEEMRIKPALATDSPAEVGVVDVVLFCVKAYDAKAAALQIKPVIGAETVVIPVLNGIDHIETLIRSVGAEHVLGGVGVVSAHREAPGVIAARRLSGTMLRFGKLLDRDEARCKAIQTELAMAGLEAVSDVWQAMWWKLATVCGVGLCSVVRGTFGVVAGCDEALALVRLAVEEVVDVAGAKQIILKPDIANDTVETFRRAPNIKPSMLVDLERGARLEVEWLNGAVSRMGKMLGVPTPINDFIYACLKPWANGAPS